MPLEVHYKNHKGWDANTQKFADPKVKSEADQIGHLLMTIGISEISPKTIDEVIIRKMIIDQLYVKPNDERMADKEELRELFTKHLGLFIEGRWARTETRWSFTARHAKGLMRRISEKVSN